MTSPIRKISPLRSIKNVIQQRLSLRLGLTMILITTVIFTLLFGYLFNKSKQFVRELAIEQANQLLDNTIIRINGIMEETRAVTNYMSLYVPQHLQPDSLLSITRRTVTDHPFLAGFAISMEPYYFPEMGRYFSAYSLRQDDSITTVREGPFEYFEKIWYKTPRTQGAPCWVDAYDDYNEGTLSSKHILTSYCCPLRDVNGHFVGSITASLTLNWLSEVITSIKPYPNSSAIMIGRTGTYLVHPDTAKLYKESIFSDAAPEAQEDINRLGKAMIEGQSGMMQTIVDGNESYIFYRPLERTGWSIAIVCPESDVFSSYNRLLTIVWTIITIGLLLLLLFCYQTIRKAISPLKQLAGQASRIADGHFDEKLPQSNRHDSVGRLTNSVILMQHSLAESAADIRKINEELELRNQELSKTYQLKMEADEQKTFFIRNMSHQIRTPLNIISGFAQVLSSNFHRMPKEEMNDITSRMKASAESISHIARMFTAQTTENSQFLEQPTTFGCNDLCREAIASMTQRHPEQVTVNIDTKVPDSFVINSNHKALLTILKELLDNASKFTLQGTITVGCGQYDEHTICFIVNDTGPGIPASERQRIFTEFAKLDSFTEGVGLGLSISRQIAHQLGGELKLDKSDHDGTRFIVTIPIE
ncbi:MAG: HAMP domain-containing protein [Prevotella sp.]|nr:HAMP domain-containing protein [Prevotella sp.]